MAKKTRHEPYAVEKYAPRTEKREFPKGMADIKVCRICGAIYYKKSWHHKLNNSQKILKRPLKKTLCPADLMIKNKQFEGEIKMFGIPLKIRPELLNLIEEFGKRAYSKDTQHRIISIKNVSARRHPTLSLIKKPHKQPHLSVTTTENQMALELAKKIHRTFKKGSHLEISYSPQPSDVVYISLTFNEKSKNK